MINVKHTLLKSSDSAALNLPIYIAHRHALCIEIVRVQRQNNYIIREIEFQFHYQQNDGWLWYRLGQLMLG